MASSLINACEDLFGSAEIEQGAVFGNVAAEQWTEAEYADLVLQLRAILPAEDDKKADVRLKKINWSCVAVGNHTAEEAEVATKLLLHKIDKHRTLDEMLCIVQKKGIQACLAEKPKHPPNEYNLFIKANLRMLKSQHPELTWAELLRKAGKKYKLLSAESKAVYKQLATWAKVDYNEQMKQYSFHNPAAETQHLSQKKANRTITPYMDIGSSTAELLRKAGKKYKLLSAESKAVYKQLATWAKVDYNEQMKQYS
ncbi:nucleolar transcription factor 1-B-like [Anopheles ziemanni]|uniref:nucleolar transcription factor 1-B-like n=1 Tax=Anopheles coustani TaxID=139045 RepID=UPI0026582E06|nr:nucleolar transcription factor 1-B-like [Anopheles coustani]XP_058176793.1 nucleolar transcription factor 1-B-like [Anopheles ziemanni]